MDGVCDEAAVRALLVRRVRLSSPHVFGRYDWGRNGPVDDLVGVVTAEERRRAAWAAAVMAAVRCPWRRAPATAERDAARGGKSILAVADGTLKSKVAVLVGRQGTIRAHLRTCATCASAAWCVWPCFSLSFMTARHEASAHWHVAARVRLALATHTRSLAPVREGAAPQGVDAP